MSRAALPPLLDPKNAGPMRTPRLPPRPHHVVDHDRTLTFTFDGRNVSAKPGDTVASALYAAGQRIFSRSFKYHRPRGLLCMSGDCPNCLMNVDGTPSVRTCTEPVRAGMRVRSQNAWPSLGFDALSLIEKFDVLLPVGFYYKTFIRPRWAWPLAEKLLRRVAGLGRLDRQARPKRDADHEHRHTDVAVVGGGPAGLGAADEAARRGCHVTLVDDQPALGGHLRFHVGTCDVPAESGADVAGFAVARHLAERVRAQSNVAVLSAATVFGGYEGGLLGVMQGKRLIHLRAKRLVIATGCHEYPAVFRNNDLPGVMLGRGVRRLLHLYAVKPGTRAVVVCRTASGVRLADELRDAGVRVAAVVDSRFAPGQPDEYTLAARDRLRTAGVELLDAYALQEAHGRRRVDGALVVPLDPHGRQIAHAPRFIPCDLLCLAGERAPAAGLVAQSGGTLRYEESLGRMIPDTLPQHVFCAGEVTGLDAETHLSTVLDQGRTAGRNAARSLADDAPSHADDSHGELVADQSIQPTAPQLGHVQIQKKQFVCLCEDVTHADLAASVAEGFDEIETLKRYSTFGMGPCQGRMCATSALRICARQAGHELAAARTTTSRPPIKPVPLGVLAGRGHHPEKRTPLHHRHLELGADMRLLGNWRRPFAYAAPVREYRAVREGVGLIDVSTLGKLEVVGSNAAALLDKVYTHTISTLRVGRSRYGVMCDDAGIIIDDGTVSRLADDRFFLTTTSGNVEAVEQWLAWWTAGTGRDVQVTNVTGGLAALNLAGPHARRVLVTLTDCDLSRDAFPYMACRPSVVAGVDALLLRIGFVGETGWEIHVPAECGEHVWDALIAAGPRCEPACQVVPFGVEAQRLLRLEKQHVIVGQDTDALSNPLEADLAWAVKFDKDDFIGKRALQAVRERGTRNALVGFKLRGTARARGGHAVVVAGKPAGRVASAAFSPAAGCCVGLAWVPVEVARGETPLEIRSGGTLKPADVVHEAFYDPAGARLRT